MVDEPGLSVGAVARRLGVAPATLRTWNRRYGIGAQQLSRGRHRRYTAEDVARLQHMHRLILRGVAPGDAAAAVLAGALPVAAAGSGPAAGPLPGARPGPGHGSGGRRIALPGATAAARGLARAVLALDEPLITRAVTTALSSDG